MTTMKCQYCGKVFYEDDGSLSEHEADCDVRYMRYREDAAELASGREAAFYDGDYLDDTDMGYDDE